MNVNRQTPVPSAAPLYGDDTELTILMPCLNEAETLETCIRKARGFLDSRRVRGEVLIADNGSTDGSQAIAESCGARVVAVAARGYGSAILGGIQAARGRFIVMGDADDSYDFANLDAFLDRLREGYDLVMGNRFLGGIMPSAMPPLHRYLGNPVLTGIGRLLFRSPVGDFHCGLRGFRRDAIGALGLNSPGMEFASEMVVKATLGKLRLTEVPTVLSPDGRSRSPHLRSWRDGWRHLRFLLQFSPVWLFFYPGLVLLLGGVVAMGWLLPQPRSAAGIGFGVNTLVFSSAGIVCGFQAMVFYVFAKTYGIRAGLLPADPMVAWIRRLLHLETGLIVGLLAVIAGLGLATYAFGTWQTASFGVLDPEKSLRIVIPSATLLILGIQIMFASCLLSILDLETRSSEARTRRIDRL